MNIISHAGKRVVTIDDLLELHNVDKELFEIIKFKANTYEGQQKDANNEPVIIQLHQVSADLKPISPLVDVQDRLKNLFHDYVPTEWKTKKRRGVNGELLAVIPHFDIHFDRIEHGKDYLKTIDDATYRLFETLLRDKPDRLLYVNGGDYFNTDHRGKTTKGTEQFNNMPENESFLMGIKHQADLIGQMSSELPVDVLYANGNHDTNRLQYLSDAMDIFFQNNDKVTIDNGHNPRKYYDWGDTTIGVGHGDLVKEKDILGTFSTEKGINKNNVYMKGHIHQRLINQIGNLIVETFASPAIPSEWENRSGYVHRGNLVGQLYDKKKGKWGEYNQRVE